MEILPTDLSATIIDSAGKERIVHYGLRVPFLLFPSALFAWIDEDTTLSVFSMNANGEPITTNQQRINLQLKRWIDAINIRLALICGDTPQTEPAEALRKQIKGRISVAENRLILD